MQRIALVIHHRGEAFLKHGNLINALDAALLGGEYSFTIHLIINYMKLCNLSAYNVLLCS